MDDLKLVLLLPWLFLTLVLASDSLLSPKGVNYDVAALMAVKRKLQDDLHVLEGWDINSVDPCTWSLVGCSPEGFVVSLEMASKGLSGELCPSIGNLTHLQTMLLQNNEISGPLPAEIGKLKELQTLDLSRNQFVGHIPSSLGFLTRLSYLRLNRNLFSGSIPQSVANLTGLSFLDLAFNNLTGPAPKILAKDYSVAGNSLLCASSTLRGCIDMSKPVKKTNFPQKATTHHLVIAMSVSLVCLVMATVMTVICWLRWGRWHHSNRSYEQQECELNIGHLKRFTYKEMQTATDNFNPKNILGQGGYGVVYKGFLRDGTIVAVKRLRDPNFTGELQFQTEVEMIGLALHRNLLRLYGFCMTSNERLLVYPYMSNGSVADRLRDPSSGKPILDWNKRMKIAIGAARGLVYLHEQCNPKIIHRDVKAANILLDESFEAVVGDFGLVKLLDQRDSHVTTAVRGTVGHIAPEYLSTGQSSEKTDVFGFGILLLELITGQKTLDNRNGQVQRGMILDHVRTLLTEKRLDEMVDKDLNSCFDATELEKAVSVSVLCTQSNPSLRPTMSEVVKVLEGEVTLTERMEETQAAALHGEVYTFSRNYSYSLDDSSFIIEAMELSGPR